MGEPPPEDEDIPVYEWGSNVGIVRGREDTINAAFVVISRHEWIVSAFAEVIANYT
jgi:hypothetical protein